MLNSKNKIKNYNEIVSITKRLKKAKKKIVLCHGVFDLLHIGHLQYFEEAKKSGDVLIVSITDEKFIKKIPNRPIFSSIIRSQFLSSIQIIDYVVVSHSFYADIIINKIKPNYYIKGPDYINYKNKNADTGIKIEAKAIKDCGGKILFTSKKPYSSSNLINNFLDNEEKIPRGMLEKIKKKFVNKFQLAEQLEKKYNDEVTIIGESIIDEYIYCEVIGKSGKEDVFNYKIKKKKKIIGGSLAIANNLSSFYKKINLITQYDKKHLNFIKKNLPKNIRIIYFKSKKLFQINKKRIINNNDKKKLIGFYNIKNIKLDKSEINSLKKIITKNINKNCDVVISDFNHGLFNNEIAKFISNNYKNRYSLMSQINSSSKNFGNLANFVNPLIIVINLNELNHEIRESDLSLEEKCKKLCYQSKSKYIMVTLGSEGTYLFDKKTNEGTLMPSYKNNSIVDRVGSGDAVFSVASYLFKNNIDKYLSLIGCAVAGFYAIGYDANENKIDKDIINKNITNIIGY